MPLTLIDQQVNSGGAATVQSTLVQLGDLVIVKVNHDGAPIALSVSDGTNSLVGRTKKNHSNADLSQQVFDALASLKSGTVTYTASGGTVFWQLCLSVFRPTGGVVVFDSELPGGGDEFNITGGSTPTGDLNSTSIITTGNDGVVIAHTGNYGANQEDNWKINGVAADGHLEDGFHSTGWYRIVNAPFTGPAYTHYTVTTVGIISATAYKISSGSGGGPVTRALSSMRSSSLIYC